MTCATPSSLVSDPATTVHRLRWPSTSSSSSSSSSSTSASFAASLGTRSRDDTSGAYEGGTEEDMKLCLREYRLVSEPTRVDRHRA